LYRVWGRRRCRLVLTIVLPALLLPAVATAQASPFLTGATALQNNILAWLTPIAVILIMLLGAMAMANRMSWGWCLGAILGIAQVSSTYGHGDAQTIVENCGNTLILRCSGSEQGGTSQFASRLIGEREVVRRQTSRGRDRDGLFPILGSRRSTQVNEHQVVENAVLASELEQLPDLSGYLKTASSRVWRRVRLRPDAGC
jgi:type IV secretory pathway VirB2 component (pilin)